PDRRKCIRPVHAGSGFFGSGGCSTQTLTNRLERSKTYAVGFCPPVGEPAKEPATDLVRSGSHTGPSARIGAVHAGRVPGAGRRVGFGRSGKRRSHRSAAR